MKITHILKTMIKYKIITSSDFYFSTILFNNQTLKIKFLALCINHFIHNGHICLPSVLIEQKKVFLTNKINLINKLWSLIQINKNFWINELLKDSHIISNGLKKTPLIFNNKNFYTYKLWLAEKKIWKFINQNQNIQTNNTNIIKKLLKNSLKEDTDLTQKIAITLSMISNIIFIIGGPGTGKTTIISKIILIFIKLFSRNVKIKLTALTGKASNNLTESINKNIKKFNITNEKINIPDYKATTLHKLLNIKYENKIKITNTKIDLSNIDLLIIDEASMIDIEIMEKLIDNIPITLKVIFIGDHNQLPSISGGHILKDICSYYREGFSKTMTHFLETLLNKQKIIKTIKNYKFSNINDKIIMLKKNYRCNLNSDILNFSNILKKNSINNKKILYNNTYQDIKFKNIFHNSEYKKIISQLAKIYKKYWLILKKKKSLKKIINIFNNCKLLCILKKGLFGVEGLNLAIEEKMKQLGWIKKTININQATWYFGKPIIILKNDTKMNLYNGELGITLLNKQNKLAVFFLSKNTKKNTSIPINLIPKHQTNWAMTVHKSQGSEFFNVTLLLPPKNIPILTKELIYTAITRSKKKLTIYSKEKIFIESINKKIKRYSGISIS